MKVAGLKAANAFWNPTYYDNRRTLNQEAPLSLLRAASREVRSLSYLALRLNRTLLIVPNVLAQTKNVQAEIRRSNTRARGQFMPVTQYGQASECYSKGIGNKRNSQPIVPVPTVEPAFYWRIKRDVRDYIRRGGIKCAGG